MGNMVIKETNGSGGMVMGNKASKKRTDAKFIVKIHETLLHSLSFNSTVPCFIDGELKLRHVDLRPTLYVDLMGANCTWRFNK
jgi:uncharacterized circularly permuted ATP-grasp superfamily protein